MKRIRRVQDQPGAPATGRGFSSLALRAGLLLLFVFSATCTSAWAATPPRIEDKAIRIGLRDGPDVARSRNGAWAPVEVPLKAGTEDVPRNSYRLVVETTDGEGVSYRYTVPVPAIPANSEHRVFAYARPGSAGAVFTVTLQPVSFSKPVTQS